MKRYILDSQLVDTHYCSVFVGYLRDRAERKAGEQLAVKQMKKKHFGWGSVLQVNEVKVLKLCRHENIMLLREVIREPNGDLYLVYPLYSLTLESQMAKRKGPLTEAQAKPIIRQIAAGLHYIHKRGIIHRNLSPAAVYLNEQGQAVLGGFSKSRLVPGKCTEEGPLTDYVVKRAYRAPELLLRLEYTAAIDIFALGVLFVELLTGRQLLQSTSEIDSLYQQMKLMGRDEILDWPAGKAGLSRRTRAGGAGGGLVSARRGIEGAGGGAAAGSESGGAGAD